MGKVEATLEEFSFTETTEDVKLQEIEIRSILWMTDFEILMDLREHLYII